MSQKEGESLQPETRTVPEIKKVDPRARNMLEAVDAMLRLEELSKGHYGMLLTQPGVVTVGIHVKPSKIHPNEMYDIKVIIKPHDEEITPEMYGGTQVAINEGAVPSKNDKWALAGFRNNGEAGFDFVPRGAVSKMRLMFPEEREQLRKERLERNK